MKLTTRQLKRLIKEEVEKIKTANDLRTQLVSKLKEPSFLKGWDGNEAITTLALFDLLNQLSTLGSKATVMNRILEFAKKIASEATEDQSPDDQTVVGQMEKN